MRLAEYVLRGKSPASPFPPIRDCTFENICGFTFGKQYLIHWYSVDAPTEIKELRDVIDLLVSEFDAQDEMVPQLRIGAVSRMWAEFRMIGRSGPSAKARQDRAADSIQLIGSSDQAEALQGLAEKKAQAGHQDDVNALLVLPVLKSPSFPLPPMEVFGNIIQFHVTNFNLQGTWDSLFEVGV